MLTKYVKEQPTVCQILKRSIEKKTISHAYLFISNQYSKTMDLALDFAKELLIMGIDDEQNKKKIIYEIDNNFHDDLVIIDPKGLWIKKEIISNLQKELSTKSLIGNKRIYIINNIEKLNLASSNSLLKFLEEPEEKIVAILITDNKYQLLDTIISRCVNINFEKGLNLISLEGMLKEKIINNLFNNEKDKVAFLNMKDTDKLIKDILNFVLFYEKEGNETLLYLNEMWHEKVKNREEMLIAFEIIIMFYREILSLYFDKEVEIFNDYSNEIQEIYQKNTRKAISKKLHVIMDIKSKIKYNVNRKLLMDQLIIQLGG